MARTSFHALRARDRALHRVQTVLSWILDPLTVAEEKQRRRIRLLAIFLLLFAANTFISAMVLRNTGNSSWTIMLTTSGILAFGYILSRTGFHGLAMALAVSVPAVPILSMVLNSDSYANIPNELHWLAIPLLVSSLLFSRRYMFITTIGYIIVIAIMVPFARVSPYLGQSLSFMAMIFFFVVAVAAIRHLDQSEAEWELKERRRSEEALRASEDRYRSLIENTSDLVQSVMPDGH
ncbi:MAG: hypothetical protein ABID71_08935, partial [Chloroflexota bacterium]